MPDALLAWSVDRMTREGFLGMVPILEVVEGGVRLLDTTGLDSENKASFEMEFAIKAWAAKAERERISARNKATKQRLHDAGRYTGGQVPFGAVVVEREGLKYLEPDPVQSVLLIEAAEHIIAGGSLASAARMLAHEGVVGQRGQAWGKSSMRSALMRSDMTREILGPARYAALVEALKERATSKGGRPTTVLIGDGLGTCASCGSSMVRNGRIYRCRAAHDGRECPAPVTISVKGVDKYLAEVYLDRHGDDHPVIRTAQVDTTLDDAQDRFDRALQAMATDQSDAAVAELRAATAALEEGRQKTLARTTHRLVLSHETNRDVWARATVAERRDMLREAGLTFTIHPARKGVPRNRVDYSRIEPHPSDDEFWAGREASDRVE